MRQPLNPDPEDEDPNGLATARGILFGVLLGSVLWLLIAAVGAAIYWIWR